MRAVITQLVKTLLHAGWNRTLLIFKYKMMAADHYLAVIYRRRNSMSHNILYFGMFLFMGKSFLQGCIYYCLCHGMREMFFQTSCCTKQFIGWLSIKGHYIHNSWLCFSKCSCLIKNNGICLCDFLQKFAAFYRDMMAICLSNC